MQYSERVVGCSGFPVDTHDIIWMNAQADKVARCPECGCGMSFAIFWRPF